MLLFFVQLYKKGNLTLNSGIIESLIDCFFLYASPVRVYFNIRVLGKYSSVSLRLTGTSLRFDELEATLALLLYRESMTDGGSIEFVSCVIF